VSNTLARRRLLVLGGFLALSVVALAARVVYLDTVDRPWLLAQARLREVRDLTLPAHRGMIVDHFGVPLAVSTLVEDLCADPRVLIHRPGEWPELARLAGWTLPALARAIRAQRAYAFMYLRRGMDPFRAREILAQNLPGVFLVPQFRRYYPEGAAAAQVVGYTTVGDRGEGGLELAYNRLLAGRPGRLEVVVNGLGQSVSAIRLLRRPRPGHSLVSSLDTRLQYVAYAALKQEVRRQHASAGSVVVVDPHTGEVLAMATVPSFNPNTRADYVLSHMRARAATDMFEPGSVFKPFTIAAALASGRYTPQSIVNTGQGLLSVGGFIIRDDAAWGRIDLTTLLEKSSNVGASLVALSLPRRYLWRAYNAFGFGRPTGSDFPGESPGLLHVWTHWSISMHASIGYGYGVAVTLLQLARGYSVLANHGVLLPLTFVRRTRITHGRAIVPPRVAHELCRMLTTVVSPEGTGFLAQIPGYRVAGKTGTSYIVRNGRYDRHDYSSVFVGMAPVPHPRLVVAVVVDGTGRRQYFGGLVAAPIFKRVMEAALRILGVPPDRAPQDRLATVVWRQGLETWRPGEGTTA
jgi:cell division protein FtsI (penicillin-binding protein 3)